MIVLPYPLPFISLNSMPRRTFRNPLIVAMEMADEMEREGLTQTELAKKHGISCARVNQWLSLLQLPVGERRRILAMGDHWDRRLLTERQIRLRQKDDKSGIPIGAFHDAAVQTAGTSLDT